MTIGLGESRESEEERETRRDECLMALKLALSIAEDDGDRILSIFGMSQLKTLIRTLEMLPH